jgi:hypothetical protein
MNNSASLTPVQAQQWCQFPQPKTNTRRVTMVLTSTLSLPMYQTITLIMNGND